MKKATFILIVFGIIFLFLQIGEPIINILWSIYDILLPFIIGIIIAYAIFPYVNCLKKKGVPKMISIILVYAFIIYIFIFIVVNLIPLVVEEIAQLTEQMPYFIEKLNYYIDMIKEKLPFLSLENLSFNMINLSGIGKYVNVLLLSPVISMYILIESDKITNYLNNINNKYFKGFYENLNSNLRMYFNGVLLVTLIMSIASSFLFALIGIDYSILLGLVIGITNIIPFIGPYIGAILVCLYALTISPLTALLVLIIVFILQTLESNFITPYIQSKNVNKSPLLILLSFVIFGNIFGLMGMLLATPLLSFVYLLYKYIYLFISDKKILK